MNSADLVLLFKQTILELPEEWVKVEKVDTTEGDDADYMRLKINGREFLVKIEETK